MFLVFLIISLYLMFQNKIRNQKEIAHNNLRIIYDMFERHLIINNVAISEDIRTYLTTYKNLVVNPEYIDPKIMSGLKKWNENKVSKRKKERISLLHKKIEETIPDFKDIRLMFDVYADRLFKLNMLKFSNLNICIFCSIFFAIAYFLSLGKYANKLYEDIKGKNNGILHYDDNTSTITLTNIPS